MTRYEELKSIIAEIDELINIRPTRSNPLFRAWKVKAERFLIKQYCKAYVVEDYFKIIMGIKA